MRILIAGMGSIGQRHLRNLQALGVQDIILYRTYLGALQNDEFDQFPVEQNLQTALSHQPDAVIVSNPTSLHMEVAVPAAGAGCHLLLEKPIADSMERVPELNSSIRVGGGQVLVGYHFRFHPGLQKVKQLFLEGAIGEAISIRAHWGEFLPDWHPWEDYRHSYSARNDLGGGVILTLSHPLDYLRWILGEVEEIWSFSARRGGLNIPVETVAEIGIRFADGTLGSVHLDYCQRPATHHLEIIGSQGAIHWDNEDGACHLYRASQKSWESFPPPAGFSRNQIFLSQMSHFLEVVRGEVTPACTLQDGAKALQLCLAALKSQEERTLVDRLAGG